MEENDEEIKDTERTDEKVGSVEQASEDVTDGKTAEELLEGKSPLEVAEYYIAWKRIDEAQRVLDTIPERSGKKFYLQSRIYKERKWYSEQRKQLKKAIKAKPDNEQYKNELAEVEKLKNSPEYKSGMKALRKNQMGDAGGVCAEGCCECCGYGLCTLICESIGNGC